MTSPCTTRCSSPTPAAPSPPQPAFRDTPLAIAASARSSCERAGRRGSVYRRKALRGLARCHRCVRAAVVPGLSSGPVSTRDQERATSGRLPPAHWCSVRSSRWSRTKGSPPPSPTDPFPGPEPLSLPTSATPSQTFCCPPPERRGESDHIGRGDAIFLPLLRLCSSFLSSPCSSLRELAEAQEGGRRPRGRDLFQVDLCLPRTSLSPEVFPISVFM